MRKLSDIKSTPSINPAPVSSAQAPVPTPEANAKAEASNPVFSLIGGAQLLLAAAPYASTLDHKPNIHQINVQVINNRLRIAATNGFIGYRVFIPQGADGITWDLPQGELQIPARDLIKKCTKAHTVLVRNSIAELLDAKAQAVELRAIRWDVTHVFPNIDQVWPESFLYRPDRAIAWDSAYLKVINDTAKALSPNGVYRMRFSHHSTPVEFSFGFAEDIEVQLLLMPVQLRDINARDQRPETETEG